MLHGDCNQSSRYIATTGTVDHTASADVVFACFPCGHRFSQFDFSFNLDMGGTFTIISPSRSFHTFLSSFLFPLSSFSPHPSAFHLCPFLCSLPRRAALSTFHSKI